MARAETAGQRLANLGGVARHLIECPGRHEQRIIGGVQGIVLLGRRMCIFQRPVNVVVLRDFAGELIQKFAAVCSARKTDQLPLDAGEQESDAGRAIHGPFGQHALPLRLVI